MTAVPPPVPPMCARGGLGVLDDGSLPNDRVFAARCDCGAFVTVVDGRIPFHRAGVDERPAPDQTEESTDA